LVELLLYMLVLITSGQKPVCGYQNVLSLI
jgi:hypothetical protein